MRTPRQKKEGELMKAIMIGFIVTIVAVLVAIVVAKKLAIL